MSSIRRSSAVAAANSGSLMVLQAVQGVRYLASMAISPLGARKMMPQQTFSLKSKQKKVLNLVYW
jgi:hypothetical protein